MNIEIHLRPLEASDQESTKKKSKILPIALVALGASAMSALGIGALSWRVATTEAASAQEVAAVKAIVAGGRDDGFRLVETASMYSPYEKDCADFGCSPVDDAQLGDLEMVIDLRYCDIPVDADALVVDGEIKDIRQYNFATPQGQILNFTNSDELAQLYGEEPCAGIIRSHVAAYEHVN